MEKEKKTAVSVSGADDPASDPVSAQQAPAGGASRKDVSARRPFPGIADLLAFLGIFLVASLAGVVAALLAGCSWPDMPALLGGDAAAVEAAQYAAARFNAVSYLVSMGLTLLAFLFYRSRRGGPRTVGHFAAKGLDPVLLLWGVVLMLAASVVLEPLLALLPDIPNVYGRGIWAVVTLVVMAPLFEELLFRGVVLESVRARFGVTAAWVVSSLLFGVVHAHPTVAVNAFFSGLILGFVYLASGSLWASMFLHAVNNGIAYVMLAAGYGNMLLSEMVRNRTAYTLIYIAAAVLLAVSLVRMLRMLCRMKRAEKNRAEA